VLLVAAHVTIGLAMSVIRFLVVDDATFIRDMLKKQLRDNFPGCQVFDAVNGRKAQLALKAQHVDLILCDWEMPEMSGEEFLRWVRAEPAFAELPFIMVTSRGEKDFIIKAAQAGVNDYLGKPFKPETLVAKVSKALRAAGHKLNEPVKAQNPFGGSVDILTVAPPSASKAVAASASVASSSDSLAALTGSTNSKAAATKKTAKLKTSKGQAQLTFPNFTSQCVISALTLQQLSGAIKRGEQLPTILDQVVVSIVQNDGNSVARLNGYVQSIQAAENRIDATILKLVIRFVDDDPEKLEHLSRYISSL
jgi:DNA-binding response OmpR family regulator